MRGVFRRTFDPKLPSRAPALLFPTGFTETVIEVAAGAVSVAGLGLSLLARFAISLKRFMISLNDING